MEGGRKLQSANLMLRIFGRGALIFRRGNALIEIQFDHADEIGFEQQDTERTEIMSSFSVVPVFPCSEGAGARKGLPTERVICLMRRCYSSKRLIGQPLIPESACTAATASR